MTKPPVPSIVLKTKKPTAQQQARIDALKPPVYRVGPPARPSVPGVWPSAQPQPVPGASKKYQPVPPSRPSVPGVWAVLPPPSKANARGFEPSPVPTAGVLASGLMGAGKAKQPTKKTSPLPVAATRQAAPSVRAPVPQVVGPSVPPVSPGGSPGGIVHSIHKPDGTIIDQGLNPNHKPKAKPSVAPAQTDQQWAQALADTLLGPVQKSTTDALNQAANARQGSVTAATAELAKLFGQYGPTAAGGYDQNIAGDAAVSQSLADRLNNQGAAGSSDIAAKLAAISADPALAARVSGEVSQYGTGAANAGFAIGAADLNRLLSEKAHAKDYGAKLPGIAGQYGLQATQQLQGDTQRQISDAITQLQQKRPDLVMGLLNQRNQQHQQDLLNRLAAKQYGLKVKETNASVGAANARTAAANAKAISDIYGLAPDGSLSLAGRKVAALEAKAKAKKATLTPAQAKGVYSAADKKADLLYHGVSPVVNSSGVATNQPRPALAGPDGYQRALSQLMAVYGKSGLTVADAKKILNGYYQPGEDGRPMFTPAQAAVNDAVIPKTGPFAGLGG